MLSSSNKIKARTLNVSGPLDVYEVLPTDLSANYPLRNAHSSIVCKGLSGTNPLEYQVKVSSYANNASLLQADGVYVLKSHMIARNLEDTLPMLNYEVDHVMLVNTSKDVQDSLADKTAVTGLGLITKRHTIQEEAFDKPTVVAVVEHSNYNNAEMVIFKVAYYIRPVQNLLLIQPLFQVNREAVVNGYIVDYDPDNNCFIVDVTGINLTNGRETDKLSSPAVKSEDTILTPAGRA
ncbi:uncharacterized protein MELLADRAFT_84293 [Melampsora larici-populina 98AG31]|uniref:Uncharacterized protein n=1 Tax=Melampsora larici-populina (strain 98AG31 / pathotype 3-4-7) TaxID=747676 RepID=F4RF77_MELLP|nr:uncharacterized protein MELLADRAFT_84293 [Melampsora larici-populina 98AG31]EGG08982.1 hypothetical protein MELLADRAFT_84293 [Melampsora larici-populina 98AG31]